ncbi:MAG: DNA internalization-related competence protein ComEC/Rec2 [Pseudonocardiales bacterium]|nr:DNA internalization-related competence protein ComEC/Rec2 [Pseudonocardiales bacterium]
MTADGAPQHDLRLVPAALAGWAVVLSGLYLGSLVAAALGVGGLIVAGAAALRGRSAVVLAAGGVAAALALVVGAQVWQVEHHPVRVAAEHGSVATVVVHLRDDPRVVASPGYGGQQPHPQRVVVHAELEAADVAGRQWRTGGRVVLLAPAQGWVGLLPGQRVRATGLLAASERSDLTVALLRVRGGLEVLSAPSAVQRVAERLRSGLRQAAGVLDPEPAGLLPALVVGDTSAMVPTVDAEFRVAGLTHLIAVSGENVAILCGTVLGLARLARLGPRSAVLVAGLVLVGFVVLCRPSPSVLRAAVMGAVMLLALMLGRRRSALPALCAAVLVLLLVDPSLGGDPGFTLSVLATGALVLLAPSWVAALCRHGWPLGIAEALAVPAAAHVVTAPVVAGLSGQVSLVAVLTNLLAAPAVAPATILGVLAAVLATVHLGAAVVVVHLAGPAVAWLVGVGHRGAAVPGGVVQWPGGVFGALLLAVIVVAVLLAMRAHRLRVLAAAGLVGALLVLVPTRFMPLGWPAAGWVMVACDVGQGDAVVLATAEPGRAVLVDTGPDPAGVSVCLDRLGVRRLALVVLSHLHADHIGGLVGALRGRAVGAVALGPGRSPPWAFAQVLRTAALTRVPVVALSAGAHLSWPGLVLDVLAPLRDPPPVGDHQAEVDGTAVNNTSVVLRASTPAGRMLLTGDVELDAQADLLHAGTDLQADVLKVPHHGSRYSAEEFLAAVRPRVAIVSVGAHNSYGQPSQHVLDLLTGAGARVMRTDLKGDIAVVGPKLQVVAHGAMARAP